MLVDPDRRVARVGAGATWSDVIAAAARFRLAPLAGTAPSVGVAGYTLGGGVGWLSRRFGFAADSLLCAEVVTADGRLRTASRSVDPELFWALRGAGRNFAVVTTLEFLLYPVSSIYGGALHYPFDRAGDILGFFGEWAPRQPDELTASVVLQRSPAPGRTEPTVVVRTAYLGDAAAAERMLRPLRAVAGEPVAGHLGSMSFAQTSAIGGTPARQFELLDELSGPVVAALCAEDSQANAVEVRYWGGAMADDSTDAGPVGHRDVPFSLTIDGPAEAVMPLAPYVTGGSFLNFLNDPSRTHTAYPARYYRTLRTLKRRYDPDNLLGMTHNIPPA